MCCMRLAENTARKKSPNIRHLCTIAQLSPAVSSQIMHALITGQKLVKQQYLTHMFSQYGELRLRIVWLVWGTPGNFNGFCVLAALLHGTLVVGVSQTAAFSRGRHLYSAGRPSRWVLAHISSCAVYYTIATTMRLVFVCLSFNSIVFYVDTFLSIIVMITTLLN